MKEKPHYSLFALQDEMLAIQLFGKPAVALFTEVIELRCSDREASEILVPLLVSEDEEEIKRAKNMFYAKLTNYERNKYRIKIKPK